VPLGKYFQMVVFTYPFWCILISQTFAYITDKFKIWISNIVRVWQKLPLWCAHNQCNTEDNYKPINIYIILKYRPCRYFCTCFDRPGTAISKYKVCHETLTVQDKTCRLLLQLFIHKQKSDYSIVKIVPLDLHFLQVLCRCQMMSQCMQVFCAI
jgi:hypothetical protein